MRSRRVLFGTLCVLCAVLLLTIASLANATTDNSVPNSASPTPIGDVSNKQVVLILAPFLRWEDISAKTTPNLWQASADGAIGNLNARSRVKESDGKPSLTEGALTISSGAWPYIDEKALSAFQDTEYLGNTKISTAYKRYLGGNMEGYKIAFFGLPRIVAANVANPYELVPGTLGALIERAGGATVAIGNSDLGYATDAMRLLRPAAIAAMNEQGMVRHGNVSDDLLEQDPEAPYGVRTNLDAVRDELKLAQEELSPDKPSLIVIDPGDGYRARTFALEASPAVQESQWTHSLGVLDDLYRDAQATFPDATIIVASQASRSWEFNREGFGPIIITGGGVGSGVLSSQSTHRPGLVIASDITTTILSMMGLEKPVYAIGTELTVSDGAPLFEKCTSPDGLRSHRLDIFKKMNNTAIAIEATRGGVMSAAVWTTVVVLLAGALVVTFADKYWDRLMVRSAKMILYLLILGIFSIPAASWLMFLPDRWPATPTQACVQYLATVAVLWVLAFVVWQGRRFITHRRGAELKSQRLPLIVLSAITALTIIIDQLLGAPASFTSYFGYSPIAAFRFYGIGNEGAALLAGACLTGLALALDATKDAGLTRTNRHIRLWGIPVVGLIVNFVAAAPMLGANVGVAAWGIIAFGVLWLLANGKRITFSAALATLAAAALFLVALILLDRFGPAQTHLMRSLDSAQQGGLIQLWLIIARQAGTNLRVLTQTSLTYIFVAVLAYLVYMRARPTGDFARLITANPYFGAGITATLTGGITAYFTEDSGVVLPALMVVYLGAAMVWLMLGPVRGKKEGEEQIRGSASTPVTSSELQDQACTSDVIPASAPGSQSRKHEHV